jgi:hypothetical protein
MYWLEFTGRFVSLWILLNIAVLLTMFISYRWATREA